MDRVDSSVRRHVPNVLLSHVSEHVCDVVTAYEGERFDSVSVHCERALVELVGTRIAVEVELDEAGNGADPVVGRDFFRHIYLMVLMIAAACVPMDASLVIATIARLALSRRSATAWNSSCQWIESNRDWISVSKKVTSSMHRSLETCVVVISNSRLV